MTAPSHPRGTSAEWMSSCWASCAAWDWRWGHCGRNWWPSWKRRQRRTPRKRRRRTESWKGNWRGPPVQFPATTAPLTLRWLSEVLPVYFQWTREWYTNLCKKAGEGRDLQVKLTCRCPIWYCHLLLEQVLSLKVSERRLRGGSLNGGCVSRCCGRFAEKLLVSLQICTDGC